MECSSQPRFSVLSNLIALPSRDIKKGLAGELAWKPCHKPDARTLALDVDKTWTTSHGYVSGRGHVDYFAAPRGWQVFALSEKPIAELIAKLLENAHEWDSSEWSHQMQSSFANSLWWELLPGAAIVAVHDGIGKVCLIRDVMGYHPLYYALTEQSVVFSSSLLQLKEAIGTTDVNENKLADLIVFGQHHGCRTVWSAIDAVMPGQSVVLSDARRCSRYSFANPSAVFDNAMRNEMLRKPKASLIAEARELVQRSLFRSLSDTPFIVQGGGGVDSSVLVALAAKSIPNLTVWSINHSELEISEESWTEPLCRRLGVKSRLADVTREKFLATLIETTWRSGQPLPGPNFVGGAILRKTVIADGTANMSFVNGGMCDTIFGGLSSFHQLARKRRIATALRHMPRRMRDALLRGAGSERSWFSSRLLGLSQDALGQVAYGSLDRAELLDEVMSIGNSHTDAQQTLADRLTWLDFRRGANALHHGYYERDEWYGGQWIFPFVDPSIVRFGFNLPWRYKYRAGYTKWLWRIIASDLIGKEAAFRAKRGFDAPFPKWIGNSSKLLSDGFVAEAFRLSFGRSAADLGANEMLLWPLMNIEIWGRIHCWGVAPDELFNQLMDS